MTRAICTSRSVAYAGRPDTFAPAVGVNDVDHRNDASQTESEDDKHEPPVNLVALADVHKTPKLS